MRLATFNVENLFRRVNALNQDTWEKSRPVLTDYKRFNEFIAKPKYTPAIKDEIADLLLKYGLQTRRSSVDAFFILNEVRGKLFVMPKGGKKPRIDVNGRGDWEGWLELKRTDLDSDEVENTGRVVKTVAADILAVVEAEDRVSFRLIRDQILRRPEPVYGRIDYPYYSLVEGNDDRGIDVGLYSRHPIVDMNSNVDYGPFGKPVFSRDCAEYVIRTPKKNHILVMVNHLKSQGYGSKNDNDNLRKRQAAGIAAIYNARKADFPLVAIVGDFNDAPESSALKPLLDGNLGLRDVMSHARYKAKKDPTFKPKPKPLPTFPSGATKFDYILLSPALWSKVRNVGVERRGIWAPRTFPHFPEVTGPQNAASDHAAVWVDLDVP